MAGPACKIIENMGTRGLTISLERILTESELNMGRIREPDRLEMIQQMADIDAVVYRGGEVKVCLRDIMVRLEKLGVLSPEIWAIYTPVSSAMKS